MFNRGEERPGLNPKRWSLIFSVLAVATAGIFERLTVYHRLEQTAVLFVGLPSLLAIILIFTPKAKSSTGTIMKSTTFLLLLAGPVLGEGFICILMAAPIFYAIGLVIGLLIDRREKKINTTLSCLIVLLPMTIEGVSPRLSFNREETVQASRIVDASASQVARALSRGPRLDVPVPFYGRIGFPLPQQATGSGLEAGATRTIGFTGDGHPDNLIMRVEESRPGYARFTAVSDQSMIAMWLAWKSAEVAWKPLDAGHTRVTWTLHFRRLLDPAWYFRPWERYAARLAADYLIQANAVPTLPERAE